MGVLITAGALRDERAGPGGGQVGEGGEGGGPGGGPGRGGILNISLFGVISPGMRPNGVFFGLFWAFFDPPRKPGFLPLLTKVGILSTEFCQLPEKLFIIFIL